MAKNGRKAVPVETRELQLKSIDGVEFIGWVDGYRNTQSRAIMKCKHDGYQWRPTVDHLVHAKSGCPMCSGRIATTEENAIEKINSIKDTSFVCWVDGYKSLSSRVIVKCDKDQYEWEANASNIINGVSDCLKCKGREKLTENERIQQLNSLGWLTFVGWVGKFRSTKSRVIVRCNKCENEWDADINNIIRRNSKCPKCAKRGFNSEIDCYAYLYLSDCGKYARLIVSNDKCANHDYIKRHKKFPANLVSVKKFKSNDERLSFRRWCNKELNRAGLSGFPGSELWVESSIELLRVFDGIGA